MSDITINRPPPRRATGRRPIAASPAGLSLDLKGLATVLTLMTLAALFLVSGKVLSYVGIAYGSPGGNLLHKIHPASYLATLTIATLLIAAGPGRVLADLWRRQPGVFAFLAALVVLSYQVVVVQKLPVSSVIDTFILTVFIHVALTRLDPRTMATLALTLHGFFLVNSLIGYLEVGTGWRLTPFYISDKLITYEWRATAFFGHPLAASAATGIYVVLLASGVGPFGRGARAALILFHLGAMSAFGGRTAMVGALAAVALVSAIGAGGLIGGRRFSRESAIAAVLGATGLAIALTVLVDLGTFDRFLDRFTNDSGSAATRLAMLSMFQNFDLQSFLFLPDLGTVADSQRRLDLSLGIESSFIAFVAYYGLAVTVLFYAGLVAFFIEIVRLCGPKAIGPLVFFVLLVSGTTGLASKTTDFAITVAMLGILLAPGQEGAGPAAARGAARQPTRREAIPC